MANCEKCGLQYSSYCIGCEKEMEGIGMNLIDYLIAKVDKENEERTD